MPSLLAKVLHKMGVLPYLRGEWREDQKLATDKADARSKKALEALAARLETVDTATGARLALLEQEAATLRATLAFNAEHRERQHDARAFDQPSVLAHVARAVEATPMEAHPMPHLVVADLMPAATYAALLDAIPPNACFTQKDRAKQNLKLGQADVIPEWTLEALGFMEEVLIPRMLVPALLQRFTPHIQATYATTYGPEVGPRVAAMPHVASAGRLMLRRPGYHLDPHLDPRRVVVTCLIYLARAGDSAEFGTTFFEIDGTPVIDRQSTFYPESQGLRCSPVKTAPFRPNSAVAFLNAGGAHGADIPKSAPRDTERYAYQFYVSPDSAALAEVLPNDGEEFE